MEGAILIPEELKEQCTTLGFHAAPHAEKPGWYVVEFASRINSKQLHGILTDDATTALEPDEDDLAGSSAGGERAMDLDSDSDSGPEMGEGAEVTSARPKKRFRKDDEGEPEDKWDMS